MKVALGLARKTDDLMEFVLYDEGTPAGQYKDPPVLYLKRELWLKMDRPLLLDLTDALPRLTES